MQWEINLKKWFVNKWGKPSQGKNFTEWISSHNSEEFINQEQAVISVDARACDEFLGFSKAVGSMPCPRLDHGGGCNDVAKCSCGRTDLYQSMCL